jgi:hypothetical protein
MTPLNFNGSILTASSGISTGLIFEKTSMYEKILIPAAFAFPISGPNY